MVDRVVDVVSAVDPAARTIVYGHLGDGNLHVNVIGPDPDDEAVDDAVLGLVLELGGSVSAEHGIGVAKVDWLVRDRGEAAVGAMRAIKAAWDPARDPEPRRPLRPMTAHSHTESAAAAGSRRLVIVLGLVLAFGVVEIVGGVLTDSLALLGGRRPHGHRRRRPGACAPGDLDRPSTGHSRAHLRLRTGRDLRRGRQRRDPAGGGARSS